MAMSAVFLVAMFAFDTVLTLIVIVLALLHAVLARFLNNLRAVRSQTMRREQGLLIGLGMQMLSHADNLRMTGADDRFFSRWSGQQARELRARQLYSELGSVNASLPGLVDALRSAAILGIGGMMVMQGEMSLGMLVGFFILAEMFLAPVERFLEFAENRQALETDLQRLEDISKTDEDPVFRRRNPESDAIHTFNGRLQLAGQLELRNVTFGYNRSRPPLIKDFNLVIKPGQRIAVVGSSGSGKSTLARLVSGVYQPWSGEIMFDDHLRDQIPEEVLRQIHLHGGPGDRALFPRPCATISRCGTRLSRTKSSSPRRGTPRFTTKSCSGPHGYADARRRRRGELQRRPAPTAGNRPRAGGQPHGAHSGRSHQRPRCGHGGIRR